MQDIHPQYLELSELLHHRLFRIPDYQRAYSWTSKERKDLFEDIEKVHQKGDEASHFMATVVCLRGKSLTLGTDKFHQLDVVDGQQRLTTLIILLKAIKLKLDPVAEERLARYLRELLVKEGEELLLLQTNHDTSHHFAEFLRRGTSKSSDEAETHADRELLKAIEECREFVSKWVEDGQDLPALADLLKNRLTFLLHEITDEKSVYTVFEVLNSRGREVAWLDRLKSILMGAAFELENANRHGVIDDLHTIWSDIYTRIGLRQSLNAEVLRFAATLWKKNDSEEPPSRLLGEQASVEVFRSEAHDATRIRTIAQWLLDVTRACAKITATSRINAVTRIMQARLLATALHLNEQLTKHERDELLNRWEKVSFRIYGMLNKDARTGVGDYVRLAWRVKNESPSSETIDTDIKKIGEDYPISEAIDALRHANCYEGWESELRYFMFRYEEHLTKKQGLNLKNEQWEKIWMESPAKSIEHIWAQSKAPDDVKHSLGNLMLLLPGSNSRLQDQSPKDKSEEYRKTGLLIAGEVATTLEKNPRWSKNSIKDRENTLLEWARVEWAD